MPDWVTAKSVPQDTGFKTTVTCISPDKFDDPNLPGEMQVTVKLTAVSCGTELAVTQSGIPELIPTEMCYLGWQESLLQLANLVEPNIPG